MKEITIEKLAKSFGTNVESLGEECIELYNSLNMSYKLVSGNERDELILHILIVL